MLFGIFFILFTLSNSFVLVMEKPNIINKNNRITKMEYEKFKNYDEIINFLPSFQASIIVNNWLSFIDNEDTKNNNDTYDTYMKKSIYDMKVFIAINREKNNTILLSWNPEYARKRSIAYIAAGKIANNTLYLERIAQNPYYEDILKLKSKDFFDEINKVIDVSSNINKLSLDELNSYDSRYWLSLLVARDDI